MSWRTPNVRSSLCVSSRPGRVSARPPRIVVHEERLIALLLLVDGYGVSAEHIVGPHLGAGDITLLERLARSASVWDKRDRKVLDGFLAKRYQEMPRTMLRYAIERHPKTPRRRYLAGTI